MFKNKFLEREGSDTIAGFQHSHELLYLFIDCQGLAWLLVPPPPPSGAPPLQMRKYVQNTDSLEVH